MFKAILVGLSSLAAIAPASAADLPVYKAPIAVIAQSWNGFYVGANVGYGWGRVGQVIDLSGPVNLGSFPIDGITGGAQIGYTMQIAPNWILGIEADIQGASIGATTDRFAFTTRSEVDVWGTVRGRLGYAVGNALIYGTGGFAWAGQEFQVGAAPALSNTHVGWAAGGGLEYAFAPNWSAKVEYLYARFGREDYDFGRFVDPTRVNLELQTVRLGVNYRFGGGPIVASY
ncbi:outer membrane protein [Variibacter gotjawalensis]|nr:outer membrane protein [Variibacter gotjawalensis]NIK46861.1 outer membrane immunogenic protein [Variibacter gotjawalensis]